MRTVVIYGSRSGNTERIATAIADQLRSCGPVELVAAETATATTVDGADLVVVGGPTEAHNLTKPVTEFFDKLPPGALDGVAAAAFDTRVRWPRWLSGSAAVAIRRQLRHAGARTVVPAESFFVTKEPLLYDGELDRATAWADTVARPVLTA